MKNNRWESIWNNHQADIRILNNGNDREVFLELKRAIGNDVIGGGMSYESMLAEYEDVKHKLFPPLFRNSESCNRSVYEVGCGSGANLLLFEKDGYSVGGVDYSESLVENARFVLKSRDIEFGDRN